jgi:hypothetical protein
MPGDKAVGISYPSKNDAINKHLSFVDLYLSDAANATKTLSVLGDMAPSKGDAKLVAEARKLLDGAIGQALTHLKQIRTHKADLEMIVPGIDTEEPATGSATARPASAKLAKLDELESNLKDARTAAKKIAGQKPDGLTERIDTVSAHLVTAQQRFRDMAKWTSYTLLDDTNLGTVPVRGANETPGEIDRDVGQPMNTTPARPGETTTPGTLPDRGQPTEATPPDRAPGTPPGTANPETPKPEPVKPAPGGGY